MFFQKWNSGLEGIKWFAKREGTGVEDFEIAALTRKWASLPFPRGMAQYCVSTKYYHSSYENCIRCLTPPGTVNPVTFANLEGSELSIRFALPLGSQVLVPAWCDSLLAAHYKLEVPHPQQISSPNSRALQCLSASLTSPVAAVMGALRSLFSSLCNQLILSLQTRASAFIFSLLIHSDKCSPPKGLSGARVIDKLFQRKEKNVPSNIGHCDRLHK